MRFTNIMPCRTTASALSMDLYSAGTLITFVVHGLIIYSPKRQDLNNEKGDICEALSFRY